VTAASAPTASPAPYLSLVVPCYDEEDNVADLVAESFAALGRLGRPFEMIVVDDASRDETLARLRALQETHPGLRVLRLRRNTGQSGALIAGFAAARGALIATADGDLQNDPADIPGLVEKLETEGWDLVSGWRQKRRDSFLRLVSTRVANGVRRAFLGDGMRDSASSMKVYRRQVLEHLPVFHGMHRFFPALARMRGFRVTEVPVNHRPRRRGVAKYGLWNRVFRATVDMFGVAWLRRRALRIEAAEVRSEAVAWVHVRNCCEDPAQDAPPSAGTEPEDA
jgi:dolichol-phosphate mannosyltransferase